jgi:TatD DNase family protein
MSLAFLFKRQQFKAYKPSNRYLASLTLKRPPMGKKKPSTPGEEYLLLPTPPSTLSIVDTHTHVASTFSNYRSRYKQGKHQTVYDFVRTMYEGRNVESIVDVWCEAPVEKQWKEFADSALKPEDRQRLWGGLEYWFVMGASPF